jgi:hypothetical protein
MFKEDTNGTFTTFKGTKELKEKGFNTHFNIFGLFKNGACCICSKEETVGSAEVRSRIL